MDWESWLRNAAKPPSDDEDSKRESTEKQIKDALSNYPSLGSRNFIVYAKGSYANNTNVRLNYDVDIAVEYRGFFFSDLMFDLAGVEPTSIGVLPSSDPYTVQQFKIDIHSALVRAFGENAIEEGRMAYRVREKKTTLPADVVPSFEYRRYEGLNSNGTPRFQQGTRIFPSDGGHIENFPAQQKANGTVKNNQTGYRYKFMVRALKRLQSRLVSQGVVKELPSYLIECLVYNVTNDNFVNTTYLGNMRNVLAAIFNATLPTGNSNDWLEVHQLEYLFRGPKSWNIASVHALASAAWDELGLD